MTPQSSVISHHRPGGVECGEDLPGQEIFPVDFYSKLVQPKFAEEETD